jgi:hypothetical protein
MFKFWNTPANCSTPTIVSAICREPVRGIAVLSAEVPLAPDPNRNQTSFAEPISTVGFSKLGFSTRFCADACDATSAKVANAANKFFLIRHLPVGATTECTTRADGLRTGSPLQTFTTTQLA